MNNILYKNFNEYNIYDIINIKNVGEFLNNPKKYNPDADFKYCTIIDFISKLNIKIETLLEPGCADCILSAYLCKKYNIQTVYLFDFDIVRGINIHERQKLLFDFNNVKSTIIFKGGDFFSRIYEIEDNSIDLIIDGCSITHFMGNNGIDCWKTAAKCFYDKLKNNGHIIISSDVLYDDDIEKEGVNGEFIFPKDIINCFKDKFEIISNIILSGRVSHVPHLRCITICFRKI